MTGGTTSSELPVFYVPMFKQSSVSKSSRIRNLSETHLSAIWLLPCDLTGLRGPQLKTCCWRDDAVASARTRVFKWPGKAPEQTPVRWFTSIKWISSCLMMPVGAELHCAPMTQAIPSRRCLSASAPCKLCHDLFSFFFFPWGKQVFLYWNYTASQLVSAKRENMPNGATANACVWFSSYSIITVLSNRSLMLYYSKWVMPLMMLMDTRKRFQWVHSFDSVLLPRPQFSLISSWPPAEQEKKSQLLTLSHEMLSGKLGQLIQTSTELFRCYD